MCLMLIAFGIMNVYSVEEARGIKQLIFFSLSPIIIIALISVSSSSSNFFETYSPLLYGGAILLLVGVLIFGKEINGAKAWFDFGFVSFQPAEIGKLATGLLLANYISSPSVEIKSQRTVITAFAILGIPVMLILLQPDLGSVLVFSAFIVALYREGFSPWYIFIPVIGGVLFLLSITYPPYYILTAVGFVTAVVGTIIVAFTYNRSTLKMISGLHIGLVFYFLVLIFLMMFFHELGIVKDETSVQFVPLENLKFNVYFYSLI